jgi:hypothetical protein
MKIDHTTKLVMIILFDILRENMDRGNKPFMFDEDEAKRILNTLCDGAELRVRWRNVTEYDIEDIIELAEVPFTVEECDACHETCWYGEPEDRDDFQDIYEKRATIIETNYRDLAICEDCLNKYPWLINPHSRKT